MPAPEFILTSQGDILSTAQIVKVSVVKSSLVIEQTTGESTNYVYPDAATALAALNILSVILGSTSIGPDAWFDAANPAMANTVWSLIDGGLSWAPVTLQAGNVIKLRIHINASAGGDIKLAMYDSAGALMGSDTLTLTTSAGWQEVTLGAPIAVTNGLYYIAIVSDNFVATMDAISGGTDLYDPTVTFGGGPPATLPAGTISGVTYTLGAYVD